MLKKEQVPWLVFENVPFILQLDRGGAMRLITTASRARLSLGLSRTRYPGLRPSAAPSAVVPGRSNIHDPRAVLLPGDVRGSAGAKRPAYGFYWTEGMRALGWAVDAVPPIKGGSSVGVASPPAILMPDGGVVTPDIRDAERLQGFDAEWTVRPRASSSRDSVGKPSAMRCPSTSLLGSRPSRSTALFDDPGDAPPPNGGGPMPPGSTSTAKFGLRAPGRPRSGFPRPALVDFLEYPTKPLSARAGRISQADAEGQLALPAGLPRGRSSAPGPPTGPGAIAA